MKREDAQKRSEEAIDELVKALEQGRSETLVSYLKMMSQFHRYSFGNCMLIAKQRPDATCVAGFHRWKELGRYVNKGEAGIAILAPIVSRRKSDEESDAAGQGEDPQKGRHLRGFRVVHVFDVSQTDGQALVEIDSTIQGEPGEKLQRLEAVVRSLGIELKYEVIESGALGLSKLGQVIIAPNLPPAETFSVLAHELAHELLHNKQRRKEASKAVKETEAEAVAFIVARAVGLEGTTRTSDYIQLYSGDKSVLMESLDRIQQTATSIIEQLESDTMSEEVAHAA